MMIDVHNHVIPKAVLELLARDVDYGMAIADGTMRCRDQFQFPLFPSFYDPQAKIEELSKHKLDAAVISIAPTLFLYEVAAAKAERLCAVANEGLAQFSSMAPGRFRWMAHVPMQDQRRALTVLQDAATAGAVGVEVATMIGGHRLDEPMFERFWAATQDLDLPVMIHPYYNAAYPGLEDWYLQNVIGNPLETMIVACRLICAGVFDRFPRMSVLLAHGGGHLPYQLGRLRHAISVRPELAEAPQDPWSYAGRIKFDSLTHDSQALAFLVDHAGRDNVFIGTDLPFDMAPAKPVDTLHAAVTKADAIWIGERNPARFFRFAGSEVPLLRQS